MSGMSGLKSKYSDYKCACMYVRALRTNCLMVRVLVVVPAIGTFVKVTFTSLKEPFSSVMVTFTNPKVPFTDQVSLAIIK